MKLILSLLLYLVSSAGLADVTLSYNTFIDTPASRYMTYYAKNGILRLNDNQSSRINLYNQSKQIFLSIDQEKGNISRIDRSILNKRVEQLNQKRLARLTQVENELNKKLQNMSDAEKTVAEELVNQLKYPEFYGAHTQIKISKSSSSKTINDINCEVYHVTRKGKLIKRICMASQKDLGIALADYQVLRNFHQFNYAMQTRLMLAMGKTDFIEIDYHQENMDGLPVEITAIEEDRVTTELLLKAISTETLEEKLFQIPKARN